MEKSFEKKGHQNYVTLNEVKGLPPLEKESNNKQDVTL
jgi:hypothetical protein